MSTDQIDQGAAPDGLTIAALPDFSADVLRAARLLGVDLGMLLIWLVPETKGRPLPE
jgi:hypothetical protein